MSKNLIFEIAKMLGVELGEEFELKDKQDNCVSTEIYKFSEDSLLYRYRDQDGYHTALSQTLYPLFRGDYEVIKLPWKPKFGDRYFGVFEFNGKLQICRYDIWRGTIAEEAQYRCGWVFRTREEAEAALPAVAAEMGVEYEL